MCVLCFIDCIGIYKNMQYGIWFRLKSMKNRKINWNTSETKLK